MITHVATLHCNTVVSLGVDRHPLCMCSVAMGQDLEKSHVNVNGPLLYMYMYVYMDMSHLT